MPLAALVQAEPPLGAFCVPAGQPERLNNNNTIDTNNDKFNDNDDNINNSIFNNNTNTTNNHNNNNHHKNNLEAARVAEGLHALPDEVLAARRRLDDDTV